MSKIKSHWLSLPIGSKMRGFVILLLFAIVCSVGFNLYTLRFSVGDVSQNLKEISRCEAAQDAMSAEVSAFRAFVSAPSEENLNLLTQSVVHCSSSIRLLPFEYEEIGAERYARTWRVRNAYQNYSLQRDYIRDRLLSYGNVYNIASALEEDGDAVDLLYQVYDIQNYLAQYLSDVSQLTVDNASNLFDMKYPMLQSIPYFQSIISIVLVLVAFTFSGIFTGSIVTPVQKLAAVFPGGSSGKRTSLSTIKMNWGNWSNPSTE